MRSARKHTWRRALMLGVCLTMATFAPGNAVAGDQTFTPPYEAASADRGCGVVVAAAFVVSCMDSPVTQADATTGAVSAGVARVGLAGPAPDNSSWIRVTHEVSPAATRVTYTARVAVTSLTGLDGQNVSASIFILVHGVPSHVNRSEFPMGATVDNEHTISIAVDNPAPGGRLVSVGVRATGPGALIVARVASITASEA